MPEDTESVFFYRNTVKSGRYVGGGNFAASGYSRTTNNATHWMPRKSGASLPQPPEE
ncbi:hypothetical protein [Morganella morganii]|uniref:hypothetical protein n=1 Tax=Morganella morganii TaxID=582 RepID=UPI003D7E1C7C